MATYQFDTEHAQRYGVNEAILLSNLVFWIRTNMAEGRHSHDGRTWTYNTNEGLCKLFPFWSPNQVRYAVDSLIKQKVIRTGDYSTDRFKRPRWFALEDEGMLGMPGLRGPEEGPAADVQHADSEATGRVGDFPNTGRENPQAGAGKSPPVIAGSDRNPSDSKRSDSPTLNVGRSRNKVSPGGRRQSALAEEAIALTGDEKSRQRYRQLAGVALEGGAEELWRTAYRATELRLKKSREPLASPGAYFCGTLAKLLGDAGIYVPVGSKDERADVRARIAASFDFAAPKVRPQASAPERPGVPPPEPPDIAPAA